MVEELTEYWIFFPKYVKQLGKTQILSCSFSLFLSEMDLTVNPIGVNCVSFIKLILCYSASECACKHVCVCARACACVCEFMHISAGDRVDYMYCIPGAEVRAGCELPIMMLGTKLILCKSSTCY